MSNPAVFQLKRQNSVLYRQPSIEKKTDQKANVKRASTFTAGVLEHKIDIYVGTDVNTDVAHVDHKIELEEKAPRVNSYRENFNAKAPLARVLSNLDAKIEGLPEAGLKARYDQYGYNELEKPPEKKFWKVFLVQFYSDRPVQILMIAAIISAVMGQIAATVAIISIVTLNAAIGTRQEIAADKSISALEELSPDKCRVLRSGIEATIECRELVPGDIVILNLGDKIPADLRLIEANDLQVNEAGITGESVPVKKSANVDDVDSEKLTEATIVYSSTEVTNGKGKGIVVATGMKTKFIGQIVQAMTSGEEVVAPLTEKLDQLGNWLVYGAVTVCVVLFVIAVPTERGADPDDDRPVWIQMLLISVVLIVAFVPEGLPIFTTMAQAGGMKRMAKRNALVRNLRAVETLGSTQVIFTDKTGTLTTAKMTMKTVYVGERLTKWDIEGVGFKPEGVIYSADPTADRKEMELAIDCMAQCSNATVEFDKIQGVWVCDGNLIDKAVMVAAKKIGIECRLVDRKEEVPFNSANKYMMVRSGEKTIVKGAPNVVLDMCVGLDNETKDNIRSTYDSEAFLGRRTIMAAAGDSMQNLRFVCLASIEDPPRPEVIPAVRDAKAAGARVVMITGDYVNTAASICSQTGISDLSPLVLLQQKLVISCDEFRRLSEEEQENCVFKCCGFARAKPEDKLKIVQIAQNPKGAGRSPLVVAMTGDGVNDAPALSQADIGVSMGITGTAVARQASSIILTDDSFASIVAAIEEGRRTYETIRKFVFYLLSTNVSEVLVVLIAVLMNEQSPLTPIGILWMNLVTDSPPPLALVFEPLEPEIMAMKPRMRDQPIVDKIMFVGICIHTVVLTTMTLVVYLLGIDWYGVADAKTMAFYFIVFAELLRGYTCRSLTQSVFHQGFLTNKYMIFATSLSICVALTVGHIPGLKDVFQLEYLEGSAWGFLLGCALVPAIVDEIVKMGYRRFWH